MCVFNLIKFVLKKYIFMACMLTVLTKIQPTNQKNHKPNTLQNMTKNGKLQYNMLLNLKYVAI